MSNPDPNSLSARAFIALQYLLPQHWLTQHRVRGHALAHALGQEQPHRELLRQLPPGHERRRAARPCEVRKLQRLLHARPARGRPAGGCGSSLAGLARSTGRSARPARWMAPGCCRPRGMPTRSRRCWMSRARGRRLFKGGSFATLYLAPFNYHRIHMPLPGTLRAAWYVPGSLFSVNADHRGERAGPVRAQRARGVHLRGRPGQPSRWCWWGRCSSAA